MRMKRLLCRGKGELGSPYFCNWIAVLLEWDFLLLLYIHYVFHSLNERMGLYSGGSCDSEFFYSVNAGFLKLLFFFWQKLLVERPPGGSDCKEPACSAGNLGLILGLGRSPGEGNCYPLQNSCLENSMDKGACWAMVHGVTKSQTQLSD